MFRRFYFAAALAFVVSPAFCILLLFAGCEKKAALQPETTATQPEPKSAPPSAVQPQQPPPIAEIKSMPTKDGFSAQLYLTTNENIFQEWVPDLRLPPVAKVARNTPILTLIVIANPGADAQGLAHVVYDLIIKKPDGTIYAEAPNMPGWNGRRPPTPGLVELARGSVTIKIEGDDPAGRYSVEATVHDNVKNCWIKMIRSFLIE
jgi:hypothetical protein